MPITGIGINMTKPHAVSTGNGTLQFITYNYPVANMVYFKPCISAHLGVTYDIDLTAQSNKVYFGHCASGTREESDAIRGY